MSNKALISIILFLLLALIFSGARSNKKAELKIVNDLNQALSAALEENNYATITPDTVKVFRSKLTLDVLKDSAYLAYCLPGDIPNGICSDEMEINERKVRGYADISYASVFGLADKKAPTAISLLTLILMTALVINRRKEGKKRLEILGNISYDTDSYLFYSSAKEQMHLSQMQRDLMRMFFESDDHILSQEVICKKLWPNKPEPDETLYSLIRHLKTTLDNKSNLKIETIRGLGYRLTKR
jgi:hypothetical protein